MNDQIDSSQKIMRFSKPERNMHWALAIPFMICYTTALVLIVVYNPDPSRPYRELLSWIHRISGVCLFIFPMATIFKSRNNIRINFQNIKEAWTWSLADIKWLCLMGFAAISNKVSLPEQGKYNAAEKVNFMALTATYPLYILTGVLIWVTDGLLISWLIHFGMALIATPLIAGHLFMAMVNPSSRAALPGMFSGFVDREFVKHHHPKWYRENFEQSYAANKKTAPQPTESSHQDFQVSDTIK